MTTIDKAIILIWILVWIISATLSWGFRTGSIKNKWTSIDDVPLLSYLMIFFDIFLGPIALLSVMKVYGYNHWSWLPNKTKGEKMLHQLIIQTEMENITKPNNSVQGGCSMPSHQGISYSSSQPIITSIRNGQTQP